MADTPKLDLTVEDEPKMKLTNPYNTFNPLYELVSNKIKDMSKSEISDDAYPTAKAVTNYVYDKTDYLTQMTENAIKLANENETQLKVQKAKLDATESSSNKVQNITENLDNEKYPSTLAVFEFGMSIDNGCKSYATGYTDYKIGEIEPVLDAIIALQNQYTGGDRA